MDFSPRKPSPKKEEKRLDVLVYLVDGGGGSHQPASVAHVLLTAPGDLLIATSFKGQRRRFALLLSRPRRDGRRRLADDPPRRRRRRLFLF